MPHLVPKDSAQFDTFKRPASFTVESLCKALESAEKAHAIYEHYLGTKDANWPLFYARYILGEPIASPLPRKFEQYTQLIDNVPFTSFHKIESQADRQAQDYSICHEYGQPETCIKQVQDGQTPNEQENESSYRADKFLLNEARAARMDARMYGNDEAPSNELIGE